jgi:hypothetical protein
MKILSVLAFLASAHAGAGELFDRSFQYDLFNDPEKCRQYQAQGGNCFQWVDFDADGSVTVIVTDIVNGGTYEVRDGVVRVELRPPAELPGIAFRFSSNGKFLIEEGTLKVWEETPEE